MSRMWQWQGSHWRARTCWVHDCHYGGRLVPICCRCGLLLILRLLCIVPIIIWFECGMWDGNCQIKKQALSWNTISITNMQINSNDLFVLVHATFWIVYLLQQNPSVHSPFDQPKLLLMMPWWMGGGGCVSMCLWANSQKRSCYRLPLFKANENEWLWRVHYGSKR